MYLYLYVYARNFKAVIKASWVLLFNVVFEVFQFCKLAKTGKLQLSNVEVGECQNEEIEVQCAANLILFLHVVLHLEYKYKLDCDHF